MMIMRDIDRIYEERRLFPGVLAEVLHKVNEEFDVFEDEYEEMKEWISLKRQRIIGYE